MYKSIIDNLAKEDLDFLKNKTCHLGVFAEPYLDLMMKGTKTIESRFSIKKIAPYNKIKKDDIVFIKKSSGQVLGYLTIKEVLFFDLKVTPIDYIREKYGRELCVTDEFWESKEKSNYATLIIIDKIKRLESFRIDKKGMQTWIVLN